MLRGKGDTCMKANSFRGLDKRRFFRAECRLNTEFQILDPAFDGLWDPLRGAISAREADEIIRKLSFKSFEADYKTMLIWLPEAMNEEAANKILKILCIKISVIV